jgi:hypothetical protein
LFPASPFPFPAPALRSRHHGWADQPPERERRRRGCEGYTSFLPVTRASSAFRESMTPIVAEWMRRRPPVSLTLCLLPWLKEAAWPVWSRKSLSPNPAGQDLVPIVVACLGVCLPELLQSTGDGSVHVFPSRFPLRCHHFFPVHRRRLRPRIPCQKSLPYGVILSSPGHGTEYERRMPINTAGGCMDGCAALAELG